MVKGNVNINKSKLYRLVKHYFEEGKLPKMGETEYKPYNSRSGWLYFSSNDIYYKAFFTVCGGEIMLGVDEIEPFQNEAGKKLFSKVYHPSVEIMKNIGIYKEMELKV